MKSVTKANDFANEVRFNKALLVQANGEHPGNKLTVQQALSKWYGLFNKQANFNKDSSLIFPELPHENFLNSLLTDIGLIPSVLMDEFISNSLIQDKGQYIRLVQALLINLSDCLYQDKESFCSTIDQIENTLQFLQNLFYQCFDMDSRLTKFCLQQFCECSKLKLDYWRLKLNQ